MPEISEGTEVVTSDGHVTEAVEKYGLQGKDWVTKCGHWKECELVRVSRTIIVRVPRECYAESLVALAEEHGFKWRDGLEPHVHYPVKKMVEIKIFPEKLDMVGYKYEVTSSCQKLTYAQDLPQIEAWLEANAESEDDCETCGGRGQVDYAEDEPVDYEVMVDCPNCTDESEDYDEPRPEDEEWRSRFRKTLVPDQDNYDYSELGFLVGDDILEPLFGYIDELEQKLQDVREELFHKESYIQRLRERLNNARGALRSNQERIKEAREKLKHHLPRLNEIARDIDHNGAILRLQGIFDDLNELEILSSDSDEGEG